MFTRLVKAFATLPRWQQIAILAAALLLIAAGLYFLIRWNAWAGWIATGLVIAALLIVGIPIGYQLYTLHKFQKYFSKHEGTLNMLAPLLQSGRTQEALLRFEGVMKNAPENAYFTYMRAVFLQRAGKLPEALDAAERAMTLIKSDPLLPAILQQTGGQYGQPGTLEEFRGQLQDLQQSLKPRVDQMRQRREKAISQRKKKSR